MKIKHIFIVLQIIIFITLCFFIIEIFIKKEDVEVYKLNQIQEAELDNYLAENQSAIIYMCIDNELCNKYNEMIYNVSKEIELIDEVKYLYTLDYANVYSKYTNNKKMAKIPVIIVLFDNVIIDEFNINESTNKKVIKEFLSKYE